MPSFKQWQLCWSQLGVADAEISRGLYEQVCAAYSKPHRHYHTLQHLDECLQHLANVQELANEPAVIELALWFHDAVYQPLQPDNEERSADWAREAIVQTDLGNNLADRVAALIMATKQHKPADDVDTNILLDCDLAILGANPARFAEYERQIRAEYAAVPETIFNSNRTEILQEFLARPKLYFTEYFREHYEPQARINLVQAIRLLP